MANPDEVVPRGTVFDGPARVEREVSKATTAVSVAATVDRGRLAIVGTVADEGLDCLRKGSIAAICDGDFVGSLLG